MKVKQLIRELMDLPPELPVVIDFALVDERTQADENGFGDVTAAWKSEAERPGGDVPVVKLSMDPDLRTQRGCKEEQNDRGQA